jgi:hypothetical protein
VQAAAELLSSYSAAERIQKARQEAAGVSDEKIEAEAQGVIETTALKITIGRCQYSVENRHT